MEETDVQKRFDNRYYPNIKLAWSCEVAFARMEILVPFPSRAASWMANFDGSSMIYESGLCSGLEF
jgi:hypothetical protein